MGYYKDKITVERNKDGEITVKMTDAVFDILANNIYASSQYYAEQGLEATSEDIKDLWNTLLDKEDALRYE